MGINHDENDLSEKTLSGESKENETQSTVHDSSSASSLYFFDGKTDTKVSKVELVRKTDNISDRVHGRGQRSCPHCAREFSSSKALGGHIRIHRNPKPEESVAEVFPQEEKSANTCCICMKSFPSIMSLCDHIKNHPEMDWKRIRYETASEPDSTQAKQQEPDLVAEKRGQEATINEKLGLTRVPEKKRKLQHSQAWNQAKFPRKELKTEKAAEEILKKNLPEEGKNIEQELNTPKADNGSISWDLATDSFSTFRALDGQRMINNIVHLGELPSFYAPIDDKKTREAEAEASIGSMVNKSHNTQGQYQNCHETLQTCQSLGNHESYLQKETAHDPFSSITLQEEVKEIDSKGESAEEDRTGFDHKESISPEAKQAGTRNVLDFDLNLPYEEQNDQ